MESRKNPRYDIQHTRAEDTHIQSPRQSLTGRHRALSRALRERGIGTLEIKKRGVDVDPAALRTKLKLRGDAAATLVLTRVASQKTRFLGFREVQR